MNVETIPVIITFVIVGSTFVMAEQNRWTWVIFACANLLWITYGSIKGASGPVFYGLSMNVLNLYGMWRWTVKEKKRSVGVNG